MAASAKKVALESLADGRIPLFHKGVYHQWFKQINAEIMLHKGTGRVLGDGRILAGSGNTICLAILSGIQSFGRQVQTGNVSTNYCR